MGTRSSSGAGSHRALNAALVIFGIGALVLLYAFVQRAFFPSPVPDPTREANPANLVSEIIQVDVRNGCGVTGIAAETTEYLRAHGFDVVSSGNYASFNQPESFVIDRVGNLDAARKVAAALGIPPDHVRQEIRPGYYLDATVVIGEDYRALGPFEEGGPVEAAAEEAPAS